MSELYKLPDGWEWKTIEELCENKSLREQMGKNSRVLAEQEFSIESVIEKTFAIYEEILSKN